jgi:hypothetical protein
MEISSPRKTIVDRRRSNHSSYICIHVLVIFDFTISHNPLCVFGVPVSSSNERVFLMRAIKFSIAHAYKYNERRLLFIPNQCKNPITNSTDSKGVDRIVVFAEPIDSDS